MRKEIPDDWFVSKLPEELEQQIANQHVRGYGDPEKLTLEQYIDGMSVKDYSNMVRILSDELSRLDAAMQAIISFKDRAAERVRA